MQQHCPTPYHRPVYKFRLATYGTIPIPDYLSKPATTASGTWHLQENARLTMVTLRPLDHLKEETLHCNGTNPANDHPAKQKPGQKKHSHAHTHLDQSTLNSSDCCPAGSHEKYSENCPTPLDSDSLSLFMDKRGLGAPSSGLAPKSAPFSCIPCNLTSHVVVYTTLEYSLAFSWSVDRADMTTSNNPWKDRSSVSY